MEGILNCCRRRGKQTFGEHFGPVLWFGKLFGNANFTLGEQPTTLSVLGVSLYYSLVLSAFAISCYLVILNIHGISYDSATVISKQTDLTLFVFGAALTYVKPIYYTARGGDHKKFVTSLHDVNVDLGLEYQTYPNVYSEMALLVLPSLAIMSSDIYLYSTYVTGKYSVAFYLGYALIFHLNNNDTFVTYNLLRQMKKHFFTINARTRQLLATDGSLKARNLQELMKIREKCVKIVTDFNDFYALSAVVVTAMNVVMISQSAYFFVISLLSYWKGATRYLHLTAMAGYWAMMCFISSWFSVNIFVDVSKEADKTVTYVHDMWNTLAIRDEIDGTAKHLQLISLRLYNRRLKFTAFGFFSLDRTLLRMIVGATTTYVVVLIQIEVSSNAKNST